eukprot:2087453-Rhodomonas_salina.6
MPPVPTSCVWCYGMATRCSVLTQRMAVPEQSGEEGEGDELRALGGKKHGTSAPYCPTRVLRDVRCLLQDVR